MLSVLTAAAADGGDCADGTPHPGQPPHPVLQAQQDCSHAAAQRQVGALGIAGWLTAAPAAANSNNHSGCRAEAAAAGSGGGSCGNSSSSRNRTVVQDGLAGCLHAVMTDPYAGYLQVLTQQSQGRRSGMGPGYTSSSSSSVNRPCSRSARLAATAAFCFTQHHCTCRPSPLPTAVCLSNLPFLPSHLPPSLTRRYPSSLPPSLPSLLPCLPPLLYPQAGPDHGGAGAAGAGAAG